MCISHTGKDSTLDDTNGATHGRPEANWRAWTQGTPCIHGQLLHKPYPIYLSATAWVWSVWYCSCQQVRNSQGSHSSQAEGRDNYKWGEEGYACTQRQDKRAVVMLSTIHDDSRITKRRRTRLIAGGMEEIEKTTMVEKYNMHIHGRYGQGRSADVIPWIQPSYCQVLETCVSSSVWECHCECAHLVQTACTVIVHQGKSTKQPLEVWQRARKWNCLIRRRVTRKLWIFNNHIQRVKGCHGQIHIYISYL